MLQAFCHYFLHLGAVGVIAYFWDRENWWKCWLLLIATMLVDLDHLLANPVFDPDRCSIGFHYLHRPLAILLYFITFFLSKNKWIKLFSLGLLFHMLTDFMDCIWTFSGCTVCYENSVIYEWLN